MIGFTGRIVLFAWAVAALVIAFTHEAPAQMSGAQPRDAIVKFLHDKYQEEQIALGIVASNIRSGAVLVEIFVNRQTRTWTLVQTDTRNLSRIVAAGTDWADLHTLGGQGF